MCVCVCVCVYIYALYILAVPPLRIQAGYGPGKTVAKLIWDKTRDMIHMMIAIEKLHLNIFLTLFSTVITYENFYELGLWANISS